MMTEGVRPRGYYLAHEAGLLAGVSGDRIGQWARRGYIKSSVSTRIPRVYSFQDVAEAIAVHELLLRQVPLAKIKRAVVTLRSQYGDWPLTQAPIMTMTTRGGKGAGLILEGDDGYTDLDRDPMQGVLEIGDLRRIADELRHGGWVVRMLPGLRSIEVDPDRLSGRPTIRGTRVPAEMVAKLGRSTDGRRTLKSDYAITERQIQDAQRWWTAVQDHLASAA